jgi:putative oxidoreductase
MTMPRFLTALRAALTIAFLYFGLRKLLGYSTDVAIYDAIGFGQFPRYITGSVEVLGAALLWWRGWEGIAGLMLLATMIIGLSALLIWVGPPYLHMLVLIAGTGTVAYTYREQTLRKIEQLRTS